MCKVLIFVTDGKTNSNLHDLNFKFKTLFIYVSIWLYTKQMDS